GSPKRSRAAPATRRPEPRDSRGEGFGPGISYDAPPSELLRPAKVGHVEPERVDGYRLLRGRRDDLGGDHALPLALAQEQAIAPALLLRPAELPGRRGKPQQ